MGTTHTHHMLQHGPILRELLQDEGPRFHRETKHSDPVVVKVINAGEGLSTGGTKRDAVHTVQQECSAVAGSPHAYKQCYDTTYPCV